MARKEKRHIPQRPEEFTPDYLTATLGQRYGGVSVTAVDPVEIGVGIGFVGEIYRCTLTWDSDDPDLPPSVVIKVPSMVKSNRALGEGLMAYEREIDMYRNATDAMHLPMPVLYHADMDPNPAPWLIGVLRWLFDRLPLRAISWLTDRLLDLPESTHRRYLVMMEDINDARPATQFDGGSLADTHDALRVLARFHAAHWMDQAFLDAHPLVWGVDRNPKVIQAAYLRNRERFVDRFGKIIGAGAVDHLDRLQHEVPALTRQMAAPPWTILHGDYRLDNILYRPGGDVVVLDYQLVLSGRAGWDVAYFITTALDPAHRSEEEALLRTYHEALLAEGVEDYPFDDLVFDTSITKELLAHRMVSSEHLINTEVEGRDQTFIDLMVCRVAGWVDF